MRLEFRAIYVAVALAVISRALRLVNRKSSRPPSTRSSLRRFAMRWTSGSCWTIDEVAVIDARRSCWNDHDPDGGTLPPSLPRPDMAIRYGIGVGAMFQWSGRVGYTKAGMARLAVRPRTSSTFLTGFRLARRWCVRQGATPRAAKVKTGDDQSRQGAGFRAKDEDTKMPKASLCCRGGRLPYWRVEPWQRM